MTGGKPIARFTMAVEAERIAVMAKQKKKKKQVSETKEAREERELKALYAKMRRKFTAADLQKYTVIEKGIPARVVLKQMEAIHRRFKRKQA
jgi:aspartyl-tRNA synthetase